MKDNVKNLKITKELYKKCIIAAKKSKYLSIDEFEKIVPSHLRYDVVSLMVHKSEFIVGPTSYGINNVNN
jgi:hypothetical protein